MPTRLIMSQLDWWKHKQCQLWLAKPISEMWLFNYCSAITSSIPTGIFRYFIIACQGTKCVWAQSCLSTIMSGHQMCLGTIMSGHKLNVSGHKRVGAQLNVRVSALTRLWPDDYDMSGHKCVRAQMCLGTNVSGHKYVWAQSCLDTNVCGRKRVWAQTCLGTNVPGHKRVWAQACLAHSLGTIVWAQVGMYGHKRVVSHRGYVRRFYGPKVQDYRQYFTCLCILPWLQKTSIIMMITMQTSWILSLYFYSHFLHADGNIFVSRY